MKATRPQLDKAAKNPAGTRLFLLHGPDEAGSNDLARRIGAGLGPQAERIVMTGAELRGDPARLADEAASLSMFGDARWIVVTPVGDEAADAVGALLEAPAAGNPVVLIAGQLKPMSKLLKLALPAPQAIVFASYLPDARDLARLVTELARARHLTLALREARLLIDATGGNRAILEHELDKLALYLDAGAGRSVEVTSEAVAAIGAAADEGDADALSAHVFAGDLPRVAAELSRLRGEGIEGITLIRAAVRRGLLLARIRAEVEKGARPEDAVAQLGKRVFWKDKDAMIAQVGRWDAATLARCLSRLQAAERDVKRPGGPGPLAAEVELTAIARQGARRR